MNNPKISVIVPIYKVEKYIHQCVDSIINQTYKNLEIILVDDGSPDRCPSICDEYAKKDSRIKVIHKPNGGLSDARNAGMSIASGDYFAFVDSDDWIEPTMYAEMMDMMLAHDLDIVNCGANEITNGDVTKTCFIYYPAGTILDSKEVQKRILKGEITVVQCIKLYNKKCFNNIKFPVGRTYEDVCVAFLPFENTDKPVGFIDKPFYNYRQHENSITHFPNPAKRYHMFLSFRDSFNFAKENVPDAFNAALTATTSLAMGAYIDCHCFKWDTLEQYMPDVEAFLYDNKRELLRCRTMSKGQKLSLWLFYLSKPIFITAYKLFFKLTKK